LLATSSRCHRRSVSGRTMKVPHPSGQEPARRGQERPVRPPVRRSLHLTAQDGQLVPKDDDLQIRLRHRALARPEQTEQTAQQEVEDRPDHGGGLSQMTVQPPLCDPEPLSGPHAVGRESRRRERSGERRMKPSPADYRRSSPETIEVHSRTLRHHSVGPIRLSVPLRPFFGRGRRHRVP
jgi:hypothetical protein